MIIQTVEIEVSKLRANNGQIEGLPKNPRTIKDSKFIALKKSITDSPEMMYLRECLVYQVEDKFIVIAGNQRRSACVDLGHKTIPCKVLPADTSVDKLKEISIKDNVSSGEHDYDLLLKEWDAESLVSWGLDVPIIALADAPETIEDLEKYEQVDPVYKIVPQYNEGYNTVVIFSKSEIDMTYLKQVLGLESKKSYKNENTGSCFVLTTEEVQDAIEAYMS